ncbi:hypothetical protein HPB47_007348, partial [Ixodes persulcatus]
PQSLTYRPSAERKILALQQVTLNGKSHGTRSSVANDPSKVRGVIHVIFAYVTDETLSPEPRIEDSKILGARRLGQTNTILVTVEGKTRWKRQKRNTKIKERLLRLTHEAQESADKQQTTGSRLCLSACLSFTNIMVSFLAGRRALLYS